VRGVYFGGVCVGVEHFLEHEVVERNHGRSVNG
jgi:hypothetical protein